VLTKKQRHCENNWFRAYSPTLISLLFFCFAKRKVAKEKAIFLQSLRGKKNGSALLSQFAIKHGGAGFQAISYFYLAFVSFVTCEPFFSYFNNIYA
jgi:hypothetical protein